MTEVEAVRCSGEAFGEDLRLSFGLDAGGDEVAEIVRCGIHGFQGGIAEDGVDLLEGGDETVVDAFLFSGRVGFVGWGRGYDLRLADEGSSDEVGGEGVPGRGLVCGDGAEAGDGGVEVCCVEVGCGGLVGAILFEPDRGVGWGGFGYGADGAAAAVGEDRVLGVDPVADFG